MASLTITAYYTRRAINWSILAFIVYLFLRLFWAILVGIWLFLFPPQPPPPNNAFGKLPAIRFATPKTPPPAGQLTFQLETISGSVPKASDSAYVYFVPKAAANLLALPATQEFVKELQLDPTPIQETKNMYRFADKDFILRSLKYDIVTENFILRYMFEQDTGLFNDKSLMDANQSVAKAVNLLGDFDLYTKDLSEGTNQVSFLKLVGDKLVKVNSFSQADAVRIDFFRRPIGKMKVYTPYPDEGLIWIIYSGSRVTKKQLLEFNYTYWPIDYQTNATYGLKPSLQAWQELQSGGGYIARYPSEGTTAVVRNVTLGYYESNEYQPYIQPIFVFEGDHGFLAYVPAVAAPWTE